MLNHHQNFGSDMIRRFALPLLFLLALTCNASAVGCTGTGSCFWEGSSGNWSDTTKWCTTDTNPCTGSTGGLPGSTDNCNFSSTSSAATVTVNVGATCNDLNFNNGTGFTGALAGAQNMSIAGNLTLSAVMTSPSTFNASFQFNATTTGKTVTLNGISLAAQFSFQGAGGGWTLQDALTTTGGITLAGGTNTFSSNGKTITAASFSLGNTNARTITLSNSTINIVVASGGGTPWNIPSVGTLTWAATNTIINISGGVANSNLTATWGTGLDYSTATINMTAAGLLFSNNSLACKSFSYTSTSDKRDSLSFQNSTALTIAAGGSLTIAGNSVINRAFINSNSLGSARTITVPNTATVTLTNVDFQDIASAGTFGTWTGTSLGDALGNSGITFDVSTTQTYTGTGGANNWSTLARWTSRVPLPQDDVVIGSQSAGEVLTADMPRMGRNLNFSGFQRQLANSTLSSNTMYGNFTGSSVAFFNFSGKTLNLQGRGAQTLTSAGNMGGWNTVGVSAFGGTYTMQDAYVATSGILDLGNGTLDANNFDVTAIAFTGGSSNVRTVNMGSGTWTLSQSASGNAVWNISATMTVNAGTSTIKLSGNIASGATVSFIGAGKTYNNIWWSNTAAQGTLSVTGANTFADFRVDGTTARTVQFSASTTTTISSFSQTNVTSGQLVSITSSSAGTPATLSKSSGTVFLRNMSIKDSTATGGATWLACASTNVSGNSGWIFSCGGGGLLTLGVGGWLLERDLNPANDNHPVGLDRAA